MRRTMVALVLAGVISVVGIMPAMADVVGEVATPVAALAAPGAIVAAHGTPVAPNLPVDAPSAPGVRQERHQVPSAFAPLPWAAAMPAIDGMLATLAG